MKEVKIHSTAGALLNWGRSEPCVAYVEGTKVASSDSYRLACGTDLDKMDSRAVHGINHRQYVHGLHMTCLPGNGARVAKDERTASSVR